LLLVFTIDELVCHHSWQVKKAYNLLMDPERRRTISLTIENTTKFAAKERRQKLSKGGRVDGSTIQQ